MLGNLFPSRALKELLKCSEGVCHYLTVLFGSAYFSLFNNDALFIYKFYYVS